MADSYAKLKEILDFDTDALNPLIPDMLTQAEITIIEQLGPGPFSAEMAAQLLTIDQGEAQALLEVSYRKGLVNKNPDHTPATYTLANMYNLLDFFVLLDAERWHNYPPELVRAADAWYFGRYGQRIDQRMASSGNKPAEIVLPLEDTLDFIDSLPHDLYVYPCDCKSITGDLNGCSHLREVCITTSQAGVNSFIDRGFGRKISKEEAKEIVRQADVDGLIHSPTQTHLCNCCLDCCYPFRYSEQRGYTGKWPKAFYVAQVAQAACIGCQLCAKRCPMHAITMVEKKAVVIPERCIGCGICRVPCKKQAISLRQLAKPEFN